MKQEAMGSSMKRKIIMPSPEEDHLINAGIAADPNTYEVTKEDFAKMRPAVETHPEIVAA